MSSFFLVPKIVRNMLKRRKKRNSGDTNLEAAAIDDTSAMGRHDQIFGLNNVEDIQYRIALVLSRVDTKENQFVDCEATPASDYRALATSMTNNNNTNEMLSAMYHVHGVLEYNDRIDDGFYDVWGEFPEVCNPGSFPSLKKLKKLRLEDDDLREVVLFSSSRDSIFPSLEEAAHRAMLRLVPQGRIACIQGLAQIVAGQLGGAVSEERLLYRKWQKSSQRAKQKFRSVVYPIGKLRVGMSRHRAFLFKALADRMHISCRLVRGLPYRSSPSQAVSLVRFADLELLVDLICQPGRLLKLEDGGPDERVREVVFAEAPPLPSEPYWLPLHSLRSTKHQSPLDATNASSSIAQSSPLTSSSPDLMNNSRTQELGHSTVSPVQVSSAFGEVKTPFDPPSPPHPTSQPKQALEFTSKGSAMMTNDLCEDSVAWSSQAVHGSINRQCSSNSALSGHSWNDEVESTPVVKSQQQSFANRLKTNYETPEEQSILSTSQKPLEQDNGSKSSLKLDSGTTGVSVLTLGVSSPFQGFDLPIFDDGEEGQDRRSGSLRQDPQDSAFGSKLDWAVSTFDPSFALTGTADSTLYEDCSIPASEIQLEGPRLAVGSYGEVFKATWNGTDVAVKKLLEQDVSPVVMEEFLSEVKIMKRLRHPNVLLFMGFCIQPPNLAIVTEFLPRGSLYKLLHKTTFSDDRLKLRMAKDVVKGMCYLHSFKPAIVHRDLKSPNLLVDKDWTIKVCDFGMSKMKANTYLSGKSQGGGTPEWMAPEVLRYESSDEKCDVYSFGVILYELVTGLPPWRNLKPMQVVGVVGYEGKQLPLPQEIDPSIASIIKQCWSANSRNRPSFQELLGMLSQFETLPCIPRPTTITV